MNYKFSKKNQGSEEDPSYEFGVDLYSIEKDEEFALQGLDWHEWTPEEVQKIIDNTNALIGDEEYKYQVPGTDFLMIIDKDEAYFYSIHSEKEEQDILWTKDKFITFMEQFKLFLEENS